MQYAVQYAVQYAEQNFSFNVSRAVLTGRFQRRLCLMSRVPSLYMPSYDTQHECSLTPVAHMQLSSHAQLAS